LSGGAIAGIVIGIVVFLALVGLLAWFFLQSTAAGALKQFTPGRYESILDEELKAEQSL